MYWFPLFSFLEKRTEWSHPSNFHDLLFDFPTVYHLQLKEPLDLDYNPNLSKINLPASGATYANETAQVSGFGWSWIHLGTDMWTDGAKESGGSYNRLKHAEARVLSFAQCQRKLWKTVNEQRHICAQVVQRRADKSEGICTVSRVIIWISTNSVGIRKFVTSFITSFIMLPIFQPSLASDFPGCF